MRSLFLIVAITCLMLGCSRHDSVYAPVVFVDTTITVKFGEEVNIPNTELSLKFDRNLGDSRFPKGFTYSQWWYNTANIGMTVMPTSAKLSMFISGEITDSSGVHFHSAPVQYGDLMYEIESLTPLPPDLDHSVPDSEFVAKVKVTKTRMSMPPTSPLFPVAIGNRWIYADTVFREGSLVSTSVETFTIGDHYFDPYGEWWVMSPWWGLRPLYGGLVMVRPDTVFIREGGEYFAAPGDPDAYASMELIPPTGDSLRYWVLSGGDIGMLRTVKAMDTSIVTSCGSFDNAWEYTTDLDYGESYELDILKPGVGIVFAKTYTVDEYPFHAVTTRRTWLIDYHINK